MTIFSWNCRGSGGKTISTLNRYLSCTKVVIGFISETRCNEEVALSRIRNLPLTNHFVVPSIGQSGGLWLIWNDEVQVRVIKSSRFSIMAEVKLNDGKEVWGLAAIYGDPARVSNQQIWDEIESFLCQVNGNACLLGDFNAIVDCNEKRGGSSQLGANNTAFRSWIHANGLLDLGHHGPCYTWSNKQSGRANINQRLDRGLGSASWALQYPNSAIFHLPRFGSDHLPILLRTDPPSVRGKPKFRVESWWSLKSGFKAVCQRAVPHGQADWTEVKSNLKKEVKVWLGDQPFPEHMLKEVEGKMAVLNAEIPDQHTKWREQDLNREHQQILHLKERYWYQRSRVDRAILGDGNTRYFHAMAVTRKRRNTIRAVQLNSGSWEPDREKSDSSLCATSRPFMQRFKLDPF